MFRIYRLITYFIYVLCYPYGRIKAWRGDRLWQGRLGLLAPIGPRNIWLHAASVGEVKILGWLVDYLVKRNPALSIHVTTMTRTGFDTASRLYPTADISFSFFPFDTVEAVQRTLDAIKPKVIVIAETEIWPNLVTEASKRDIPVILVNARMSPSAFGKYKFFRRTMGNILNQYDRFFFKTEDDARRYEQLGVEPDRTVVAGDMKFDAPVVDRTPQQIDKIKTQAALEKDSFVFVAGSTRPGEEGILADIFKAMESDGKFVMIMAPRHIERSNEIKMLLQEKQIAYRIYGEASGPERFILVDRLGILTDLYGIADISFVGGTLVDIGGHNLLEPVWAGSPVLFGPSLHNVREAADYIQAKNYGGMVESGEALLSVLKKTRRGDILYATKQSTDPELSATTGIGEYILKKLSHV